MSQPQRSPRHVRVCLVGHGGAGKSAIATRFLQNHFQVEYDPNIGTPSIYRGAARVRGDVER